MVRSRINSLAVATSVAVVVIGWRGAAAAQTADVHRTAAGDTLPGGEFRSRFDVAKHAFDRGQYESAADAFGELAADDSDNLWVVESKFYLAEALVQLRRFSEARPLYQAYLATHPVGENAIFAQFRMGETAFFLEQFLVAERALVTFIREHSSHDLATKAQRMIQIMPSACLNAALQDVESWRKDGKAQKLAAAEGRLNAYLAAFPTDKHQPLARYTLGRVLFEQQRYAQANAVFSTAIDSQNAHELGPHLYAYSGEAYLRVGNPRAAAERFRYVLKHWPDSSPAPHAKHGLVESLIQQARADIQARQFDAARQRLREVVESFPESGQQTVVDDLFGHCWLQQGEFVNARKCWARVLRSTATANAETAAKAQWQIAQSFQQQAQYRDAVREYLRLATIFERQPQWQQQSYLAASECYKRLGDFQSAQTLVARSRAILDQEYVGHPKTLAPGARTATPNLVSQN